MCTLVARIVKLRPVHVTFLTLPSLHARVQGEVARDFQPGEEHLASRIRYLETLSKTHEHSLTQRTAESSR